MHFKSYILPWDSLKCFQRYEGTGRSLSLKLLQQLEEQSQIPTKNEEISLSGILLYFVCFLHA